ncbi:uncharacterized protein LOC123373324 isoform X1 [Mauremys mutica]|uniref:uncharacterized protein LOC123373324 isoform X1 n=1 Tax=Mauremys mutica TaxID=74926 RepID=UPI001D1666FE|nr:uncharacterized protein LOC123373324 isoform X1 [Mauremys mutica]XP_044878236.1 uncharacterized protein LOC123373324 isoform X1 [Mauremys mutica]XP_044878237.1 uncharacterized protein LOC123373324 isoform X1 [Mauremys mutica]
MQLSGPCLSVGTVERQSSWPDHRRRNASEIAPLSVPALEQNWRQRQFWVVAKRSTRGAPHSQKSCRATCQWSDHSYWRENTLLRPRPAHVDSRNCIWACTWDRELPFRSQSSRWTSVWSANSAFPSKGRSCIKDWNSADRLDRRSQDALRIDMAKTIEWAAVLAMSAVSEEAWRAAFTAAAPSSTRALNSFLPRSGRRGSNFGRDPHKLKS